MIKKNDKKSITKLIRFETRFGGVVLDDFSLREKRSKSRGGNTPPKNPTLVRFTNFINTRRSMQLGLEITIIFILDV